ncbi:MAG: hypothetical protein GOMPHAMPRED_005085 [Gomphillus americanus]|uniref:Uncharacterized protein n=1 Tax=Gomphillus americanus TaxID=1940652 RepID=A0A8H3EII2_9LECA|nr:MAG: hypothetical protein GOMPHAMPRED_005085 [Gomphillus americanus]
MASLPNAVARFDGSPEPFKLVQDRKRDLDHRSKYALGATVRVVGGRLNQRAIQPVKILPKICDSRGAQGRNKGHLRYSIKEKEILTSDTTTDEDSSLDADIVAPDADIAYSFDSTRGPSEGNDVFSAAVTKAVERFETKETEKLVKNEYYVLGDKDYEVDEVAAGYFGDNDDDFEWVATWEESL